MLVTNMDAPTGGIQKNTRLLLREFAGRGIKAYVSARNYHGLAKHEVTADGTVIRRSPVAGASMALNGVLYLADAFFWLVRNRKKYDVIHCQQMYGPTMAAAAANFFVRKPIVTRITLSGKTGEVDAVRTMPLASLRLRLLRRVTRWVALTNEMRAEIETLGVPPERIDIIHNSTEIPETAAFDTQARSSMRAKLGLAWPKIAVFVGRLSEEKNLDILINAWPAILKRHADAHLMLLGEGGAFRNVEAELRELVDKLGVGDSVHFLGHKDNAKEHVLASDVFVLPTRTEGMSNALVEAFACGAAIVATDIEANKEICVDGENSILVPVGDAERLADAIANVLDSADLAERIGTSARRKAEQDLSVDTMVTRYIASYRRAIEANHA